MGRSLSEMSLEELWELFPIVLTPHQEQWRKWYEEEYSRLFEKLRDFKLIRISHIGSTAVNNICYHLTKVIQKRALPREFFICI